MAEYRYCGRSGWFLKLTTNDLCSTCDPLGVFDIRQRAELIQNCLRLISESKNLDVRLNHWDFLIQNASGLMQYEQKGIRTISPLPSALLQEYTSKRDEMVAEALQKEFETALEKANTVIAVRPKINVISKFLQKLRDFKAKIDSPQKLEPLDCRAMVVITEIQLNAFLDAARKAEFKGQKKKALDQYYEALYLLKQDEVDDSLQQNNISLIESKIRELGGDISA